MVSWENSIVVSEKSGDLFLDWNFHYFVPLLWDVLKPFFTVTNLVITCLDLAEQDQ